jgi:hypothetical protein
MKNSIKYLFLILLSTLLLSCVSQSEDVVSEPREPEGTITIFKPDGSILVEEGYDIYTYDSGTRTYWSDMSGKRHNTSLPTIIDHK